MKKEANTSFVAIDVETATSKGGICQIGIVTVVNGVATDKECLYIQPPGNIYCDKNIRIHGITPERTAEVPTFADLWPRILNKLAGKLILGHNVSFDLNAINTDLEYYNLAPFEPEYICTNYLLHAKLTDCCRHYGIQLCNHHDALCDAEACANVYLAFLDSGEVIPQIEKGAGSGFMDNNKLSSDVKVKDLANVKTTDTIFYDKIVVITGVFERYPIRETLAQELKEYGADINGSISKKTNFVIVGNSAGPKKLQKIASLQAEGHNIQIINESEIYDILESINHE